MPEKDFLYENDLHIVKKIAAILRVLLLVSMPMLLLFIMSGQFYLSYGHFFWICALSVVVIMIPTLLLKLHASIELMKFATVLAPTIVVGILATEIHVVLYLSFGLGLAISLFYHDKKLTAWTAVLTYIIIVPSVAVRSYFVDEPQFHYWMATCIGYLMEILVLGFVTIRIAGDSRVMLEKMYSAKMQAQEAEKKARQSDILRAEKQIAVQANRAKSAFLANMSHEIRTPINAIMGMNEMVLRESKEPDILQYAEDIQRAGETLLSIINDILDFSKIESGKLDIEKRPYRMQKLLTAVLQMIENKARDKGLKLQLAIDENLPSVLLGDELRLRQIMINLLNNAVKYTEKGSVTFTVTGKWQENEFLLCFGVKDTGIGIRQEDQHKLFYVFERLDLKHNQNIEGTGLGLVITKKLVDAMNGTISVESEYGVGSTFSVRVPQGIRNFQKIGEFMPEKRSSDKADKMDLPVFTAPTARILIVDDNEMNLTVASALLKRTQVQVTCCHGGEECLEVTKEQYFDVILMDHMMPGMDGIETLHALRDMEGNRCSNSPVIAMTANAMVKVRSMYLQAGFDDYISKPVHGRELELLLQQYIEPHKIILPGGQEQRKLETRTLEGSEEAIFNRELGLLYCGGEMEVYGEVLRMFAALYPDKAKKAESLFEREDYSNYVIEMHALKSSALTLGAEELSRRAKELELAGKKIRTGEDQEEESIAFIKANHRAVMTLYKQAAEKAEEICRSLP